MRSISYHKSSFTISLSSVSIISLKPEHCAWVKAFNKMCTIVDKPFENISNFWNHSESDRKTFCSITFTDFRPELFRSSLRPDLGIKNSPNRRMLTKCFSEQSFSSNFAANKIASKTTLKKKVQHGMPQHRVIYSIFPPDRWLTVAAIWYSNYFLSSCPDQQANLRWKDS